MEMHHEYDSVNPDGFCSIKLAFVEWHGLVVVLAAVKSDRLVGALWEAFVKFHH